PLGDLAAAYVGGVSRVTGAVLAGLVLADGGLVNTALNRWVDFGRYQRLVAGVALILAAIHQRTGLAGPLAQLGRRLRERLSRPMNGSSAPRTGNRPAAPARPPWRRPSGGRAGRTLPVL